MLIHQEKAARFLGLNPGELSAVPCVQFMNNNLKEADKQ